ncbi:MAG TPA: hypothetical protein VJ891_15415 [Casimicrobiaceae bacterium]|nr:hypothetical protein [Casimicrobiaceae bacterium]
MRTSDELRRLADGVVVIATSIGEQRRDLDRIEAAVASIRERLEQLLIELAKQHPHLGELPPAPMAVNVPQAVELTRDGALVRWKALPAIWRIGKWTLAPALGALADRLILWLHRLR